MPRFFVRRDQVSDGILHGALDQYDEKRGDQKRRRFFAGAGCLAVILQLLFCLFHVDTACLALKAHTTKAENGQGISILVVAIVHDIASYMG